jgi:hypothetical protein
MFSVTASTPPRISTKMIFERHSSVQMPQITVRMPLTILLLRLSGQKLRQVITLIGEYRANSYNSSCGSLLFYLPALDPIRWNGTTEAAFYFSTIEFRRHTHYDSVSFASAGSHGTFGRFSK